MSDRSPAKRSERHERTRAVILDAARRAFAENGYQKATIRAVAALANCDAALVMQYFGTKRDLFKAATTIDVDIAEALGDGEGDRVDRTLRHTFGRMDANPLAAASTLRTMLTHDDLAQEAFQLFNPPAAPTDTHPDRDGDDLAQLHTQLLSALVLGTAINRYVLRASEVQKVSLDKLIAALRPAAEALDLPPEPLD